jgi:hypothetical protein
LVGGKTKTVTLLIFILVVVSAVGGLSNVSAAATITFNAIGLGSTSSAILTVDGQNYTTLPQSFSWNSGTNHTYSWVSPINDSSSMYTRYQWKSTSGMSTAQNETITVSSSAANITATYATYYSASFNLSANSLKSADVLPNAPDWYQAGSVVTIYCNTGGGVVFYNWSTTSLGLVIADPTIGMTTVTINGPGTVSAYVHYPTVTFSATGLGNTTSTILTVDGVAYSSLPQTLSLPLYSTHTFNWSSTVNSSSSTSTRFGWKSSTNSVFSTSQNGPFAVGNTWVSVTAVYSTYYYMCVNQSDSEGWAILWPPAPDWYEAGSVVDIYCSVNGGLVFDNWASTSSELAITRPTYSWATVTINGAGTVTAYVHLPILNQEPQPPVPETPAFEMLALILMFTAVLILAVEAKLLLGLRLKLYS